MCIDMSLLLLTVTLRGVSNKHCLLPLFSFSLVVLKNVCSQLNFEHGPPKKSSKLVFLPHSLSPDTEYTESVLHVGHS